MTGTLQDSEVIEFVAVPLKKQLLSEASFIDPRYKDIISGDHFKDAILEETLAMTDERCDGGNREGAMCCSAAGEGEEKSAPPPKTRNLADLLGNRKAQPSNPVPNLCRH
ncbi:hypothetical protein E1301_Tti018609 [Triplophysa tibetana]|uniref:Uncharacterized protein n=1 Tax=Triplophysa tibetana TaxID=1572043 RepID=A0A5A9NZ73_9TELE|nr:hypothetical protein E1301_Tti018609 [Triplophysa tibetana]